MTRVFTGRYDLIDFNMLPGENGNFFPDKGYFTVTT